MDTIKVNMFALSVCEIECKNVIDLLEMFRRVQNVPTKQSELQNLYEEVKHTDAGKQSFVRNAISQWNALARKYNIGVVHNGEHRQSCTEIGYHRVCRKVAPNSKREKLAYIDTNLFPVFSL